MPEPPFAITEKEDVAGLAGQTESLIGDIYQERLGGAEIGDVFTVGDDDVLSLLLADNSGLQKTSSRLEIKQKADSGLQVDTDGQSLKVKADNGLAVDSDGLQVVVRANYGINMDGNGLALIKQAHEADASAAHNMAGVDSVSQANLETALDALGTKINNILAKLEALKAFST